MATRQQIDSSLTLRMTIAGAAQSSSLSVFFGHVNAYFARNSEGVRPVTFLKIRLKWCVYPKPSK